MHKMNVTDIRIRKIYGEERLKALVSVTLDGEIAIHDIKVIGGPERTFVAMPSRRDDNGIFRDVVHPITRGARAMLEEAVLTRFAELGLSPSEPKAPQEPGRGEQ